MVKNCGVLNHTNGQDGIVYCWPGALGPRFKDLFHLLSLKFGTLRCYQPCCGLFIHSFVLILNEAFVSGRTTWFSIISQDARILT